MGFNKLTNRHISVFLFTFILKFSFSQSLDELKGLDNDGLYNLFYKTVRSDTLGAKKIAKFFIEKNIKEKSDTITLLDGYTLLIESDLYNHNKYIDSINHYSTFLKSKLYYPANGYFVTALTFADRKKFNEALDKFIIARNLSIISGNNYIENLAYMNIGLIKLERVNNEKEALNIFRDIQEFFHDTKYKNGYSDFYAQLIFNLSETFQKLNKLDSAEFYINYGRNFCLKNNQIKLIGYFDYEEGIIEYKKNEYRKSLLKLNKSLKTLHEFDDYANIAINHYYQALSYKTLNDNEKVKIHYKKVDSIFDNKPMFIKEIRQHFVNLKNKYRYENNLSQQLNYLNRLTLLDSIYLRDFRDITQNFNDLNSESLEKEKLAINKRLNDQSQKFKKTTIIYGLFSIFLLGILSYFILKYAKKQKKKFLKLINNSSNLTKPRSSSFTMSDVREKELLTKLENFENSNGFLKKDILIQDFAKNCLGSNDKYLRSILSKYKGGHTFTTYLNELRINWFINKIRSDKSYRNYTLKAYADESGFTTYSTFARAFEKKTGLKPYFFLNQLLKISNSKD